MPKKNDKDKSVAVGDRVQVNLHHGKLEEEIQDHSDSMNARAEE